MSPRISWTENKYGVPLIRIWGGPPPRKGDLLQVQKDGISAEERVSDVWTAREFPIHVVLPESSLNWPMLPVGEHHEGLPKALHDFLTENPGQTVRGIMERFNKQFSRLDTTRSYLDRQCERGLLVKSWRESPFRVLFFLKTPEFTAQERPIPGIELLNILERNPGSTIDEIWRAHSGSDTKKHLGSELHHLRNKGLAHQINGLWRIGRDQTSYDPSSVRGKILTYLRNQGRSTFKEVLLYCPHGSSESGVRSALRDLKGRGFVVVEDDLWVSQDL